MARLSIWRRRQLQPASLLLMASYASASSLTLSSFQLISSMSVPLNCIFAYNTPLSGCTLADFTMGNTCSATCIISIKRAETDIQASCESVDASKHTLLYKGQQGTLVEILCNNEDDVSSTTSVAEPVATTVQVPTSSETTIKTSARTFSRITRVTSTLISTTTSSAEDETTTEPATIIDETSTSDAPPSTTFTATTTAQDDSQSSTTAVSQAPQTIEESQSSTESEAPRRTVLPGSGGGSPFDFVAAGASIRPSNLGYLVGALSMLYTAFTR